MDKPGAGRTALAEVLAHLDRGTVAASPKPAPRVTVVLGLPDLAPPVRRDWIMVPDPLD